jgi:hypothetical protein
MLVPFPGTRDFNHFFSGIPLDSIEWANFVAIGEKCVLQKSAVDPKKIEKMVARANLLYYFDFGKIFSLIWQVRTPYELFNYLRGGLALVANLIR